MEEININLLKLLNYISDNYEKELKNKFKNNDLNRIVKENLDAAIPKNLFGHNYFVKFSSGQGRWAFYPWIVIFDKKITSTAQKGYYVALLFTNDYKEVYLSLNQGWNYYGKTFGNKLGREHISDVSNFWKDNVRVTEKDYKFNKEQISLDRVESRNGSRGEGYALGNIISKNYIIKDIDNNEELISDLLEMVGLLKDIKSKFLISNDPIDKTNRFIIEGNVLSDIVEENEEVKSEDKKRELILTRRTYNKKSTGSYNKSIRTTKRNYLDEAEIKQYNGHQGEELVLNYETKRLKEDPILKNYVNNIEHVSITQGDGLGYDIKSFDLNDNGDVEELLIEVKTVQGNINTSINLSLKEYKVAEENNNYKIYKVFNYKSDQPELIIIDDIKNDSLYIEPSGYYIKVKPNNTIQ